MRDSVFFDLEIGGIIEKKDLSDDTNFLLLFSVGTNAKEGRG